MHLEVIPQIQIGNVQRYRVGDILNNAIAADESARFRFAVAYMRTSGLERLSVSIEALLNRGGRVSGVVGIDDSITSIEALEMLREFSSDSTIFYTVSGYIYHPKLYLIDGEKFAIAIVGSSNLTRDGLFRNVELATSIYLDFESRTDFETYKRFDTFLNELLNTGNPNIQLVENDAISKLTAAGLIKHEFESREPGPSLRATRSRQPQQDILDLFPPLQIPVAPPGRKVPSKPQRQKMKDPQTVVAPPPIEVTQGTTFIMQLSAFDSSHRTGVKGTSEILVPHLAKNFFPPISISGRKYPDVNFDVVLNVPTGRERYHYRFWYYEKRATGKPIDEYRLSVGKDTIDLSTLGGGDLLVINKLPEGNNPMYEVTVLPQTDPTFASFLALCTNDAQGKKWGIV